MHVRSLIVVVVLVIGLGCERENRDLGDVRSGLRGSPQYTAQSEISAVPAAVHVASIAPVLEGGPIDGAAVYATSCGACHQVTGQGIPNVFPPLVGTDYVVGDNVERLAAIMLYGLVGPMKVLGVEYNGAMAGLGAQFSDEELAAVATYIRNSWGNSAGEVGAEVFSQTREKWGTRGPFNINELGAES